MPGNRMNKLQKQWQKPAKTVTELWNNVLKLSQIYGVKGNAKQVQTFGGTLLWLE